MRVHLSFRRDDGGTEGFIAVLDVVPRKDEEVLLLDPMGETLYRQRAVNVRHIVLHASSGTGAQQVEVTCE